MNEWTGPEAWAFIFAFFASAVGVIATAIRTAFVVGKKIENLDSTMSAGLAGANTKLESINVHVQQIGDGLAEVEREQRAQRDLLIKHDTQLANLRRTEPLHICPYPPDQPQPIQTPPPPA